MSLLSKVKQDARAADRKAREKAAGVKQKGKQDARAAERAALRKKSELQRKAKQDVKAAERALRKRAREDSGRTPGDPSAPKDTREIFELAGSSAGLRSPVEATLDPAPDGPGMEGLTTGGGLSFEDSGGDSSEGDALLGGGLSFDEDSDKEDDDLGVGASLDVDDGGLL